MEDVLVQSKVTNVTTEQAAAEACWKRIGVEGDRTCPRLPAAIHCRNCPVFSSAGERLLERDATPDYLDEWTRRLAKVDTTAAADSLALLIFRVGDEWLALDARCVVEVVEPHQIHSVPHRTNRVLLGLANIRGELQLCISLRELLAIGPSDGTAGVRQRLLVVEQDQSRWAFPVDEVEGVERIPPNALQNLPHTLEKSPRFCCKALFSNNAKQIGLLSEARLFQSLERTV